MGYTHYWEYTREITPAELDLIGDAVAKFIREAEGRPTTTAGGYHKEPVQICGGDGQGKPELSSKHICLNGNAPNLDHETFIISSRLQRGSSDFCKTARKPYDVVVTATLAYLAAYYGLDVSSDGDAQDWEAGVELANKVLDVPVPNPLIVNQLAN